MYERQERYAEAIADYTRALELDPDCAMAYFERARALAEIKDYDAALLDYGVFFRLEQASAAAAGYSRSGLQQGAGSEWLACAHGERASLYMAMGSFQLAVEDYSKVIELTPEVAVGYLGRSRAYEMLSDHARAAEDFKKAIEIDPRAARSGM
jgi:tetratricopeptide (TPR) repeat protein